MAKDLYKSIIGLFLFVYLAALLAAINTAAAKSPVIDCCVSSDSKIDINRPHNRSIYSEILPLYWRISMYDENSNLNNDPTQFHKRSYMDLDPEIQELEDKLRQSNLIFRDDIQMLLKIAYSGNKPFRQSAIDRINIALDAYEIKKKREPDTFNPYGPELLLKQGDLHLLDQMDGVPWLIPVDAPLTGILILGPQQSAKSRLIVQLCLEIQRADPEIVITLIDPKNDFRPYAPLLSAEVVDLDENPIRLKGTDNISESKFVL